MWNSIVLVFFEGQYLVDVAGEVVLLERLRGSVFYMGDHSEFVLVLRVEEVDQSFNILIIKFILNLDAVVVFVEVDLQSVCEWQSLVEQVLERLVALDNYRALLATRHRIYTVYKKVICTIKMMLADIIPNKPQADDGDSDWSDVEPAKERPALLLGDHQEEMDEEPRGGIIRSKHEIVPQPYKEEETEEAREQR